MSHIPPNSTRLYVVWILAGFLTERLSPCDENGGRLKADPLIATHPRVVSVFAEIYHARCTTAYDESGVAPTDRIDLMVGARLVATQTPIHGAQVALRWRRPFAFLA